MKILAPAARICGVIYETADSISVNRHMRRIVLGAFAFTTAFAALVVLLTAPTMLLVNVTLAAIAAAAMYVLGMLIDDMAGELQ